MDKSAELNKLIADHDLVAHYTSKCKAIEYILPKQEIKFSSLGKTNDPYEFKAHWSTHLVSLITTNDDEQDKKNGYQANQRYSKIKEIIKKQFPQQIKIFCAVKHEESYLKPRMWAQYSENHTGVCLLFSKDALNNCIKKRQDLYYQTKDFSLNYEDTHILEIFSDSHTVIDPEILEKLENSQEQIFRHFEQQIFSYLKFKHSDWNNEDEYRWIVFSKTENDFFIDYGNALKAIVLGCEFHDSYTPAIINLLKNTEIQLFKLAYENGKFLVRDVAPVLDGIND